jgi:hypothetical protein
MNRVAKLVLGIVFIIPGILPRSGAAAPPLAFDPAAYHALADTDSDATIPAGTRITTANWQQYRQFMPLWMQAAYIGQYHWHVEPGKPEYIVEVTPGVHYPLPVAFVENTAKYGGQARLEELPSGGFTWRGYVAGLAFPKPAEPNAAVKIMYNSWAGFSPLITHWSGTGWSIDRFGNIGEGGSNSTFYRLSHLSEPGQPLNLPFAGGIFYSSRVTFDSPEQVKYFTEMTLQPDDPTRVAEVYAFLPSLRRALRLSSAARCAPILGTDFVQDDNDWLPANYEASLLGEKKVLIPIASPDKAYDPNSYVQPSGGFPGWMKPTTGKWELRDFYVLDMKWIRARGSFCYSHRIVYIDAETWARPTMGEFYDRDGKFWKSNWSTIVPIDFRGQHTLIMPPSICALIGMDFQNGHATQTLESPSAVDDTVPEEFKDIEDMTSPGMLANVMK